MVVRRRIGSERQPLFLRGFAQVVQTTAGQHGSQASLGIDVDHPM
jgi:hypothetical protein